MFPFTVRVLELETMSLKGCFFISCALRLLLKHSQSNIGYVLHFDFFMIVHMFVFIIEASNMWIDAELLSVTSVMIAEFIRTCLKVTYIKEIKLIMDCILG